MHKINSYVVLFVLVVSTVLIGMSYGQTSYPMVMSTYPVAVPSGEVTEVEVKGRYNFYGAYKVLFSGTGVSAEVVPPEIKKDPKNPDKKPSVSSLKLRVRVRENAHLGIRDFRVATPQGVSSIGQLVIVDGTMVSEEKLLEATPSSAESKKGIPIELLPQEETLHITGRIESDESIDSYQFHAEAGDRITFAVICKRLQDKIHDLQKHADPILFIKDINGTEIASSNNFYFSDPLLNWECVKSGEYLLQLRDVRYSGDARWTYVLSVTKGPFVLSVFPMAARAGAELRLECVGYNLPDGRLLNKDPRSGDPLLSGSVLAVPSDWLPGVHPVRVIWGKQSANPVPLLVSELPLLMEDESVAKEDSAIKIGLPAGINGRLLQEDEIDKYQFHARKSQRYKFEVVARRLMSRFGWYASELDSHLSILDKNGKQVAENDDAVGKDSRIEWVAPEEGGYVVQVRDLNFRGGPTFGYYLKAVQSSPEFDLRCDSDKAMIGPGSNTVWYVHVDRKGGFDGAVTLKVEGLPDGVKATCATIDSHMSQGAIILSADWDAPVGVSNVQVIGTAVVNKGTDTEQTIEAVATPLEEIYNPGGGRRIYGVSLHTVSVTDRSDLVQLLPSKRSIDLRPGQRVRVDINFKRRDDYTGAVTIDPSLQHLGRVYGNPLPPGITVDESASKLRLAPGNEDNPNGETRAHIVFQASADAKPVSNLPIAVMGYVSINFVVKVGYSTPPLFLTVTSELTAANNQVE